MTSSSLVDPSAGREIGSTDPVPPPFRPTLQTIIALRDFEGRFSLNGLRLHLDRDRQGHIAALAISGIGGILVAANITN